MTKAVVTLLTVAVVATIMAASAIVVGESAFAEPKRAATATWTLDTEGVQQSSRTFTAIVERLGCGSGETGHVRVPTVESRRSSIVVTFTVDPLVGDQTCPRNSLVPYVVRVGEPIGDRRLVDGACVRGVAKRTAACESGATRWAPPRGYRMTPSDRTVLPGQIVTVTVHGPGVDGWGGGVASSFEGRRHDGSWQTLYTLQWWGENRGDPWVADRNTGVVDLLVDGSPFQAIIPPVKPGTYRVTRRFLLDPAYNPDEITLSTRLTVKPCPRGEHPAFTGTPQILAPLGTPACAPR